MIEVVLAIGIFLISVLALVGLLGPTLSSVDNVTQADEVSSVVNTVNSFLMNSPESFRLVDPSFPQDVSGFDAIYSALQTERFLTLFVYRRFIDASSDDEVIEIGFADTYGQNLPITTAFSQASGPIYRVLLSASSVTPESSRNPNPNAEFPFFELTRPLASYPEGYLAMEVRIFSESAPGPSGDTSGFSAALPDRFLNSEPIFTYPTAIVR